MSRNNWTLEQWRTHAEQLEGERSQTLDGWQTTIHELEAHAALVQLLRDDLSAARGQLAQAVAMLPEPLTGKRRGRPQKAGPWLLEWFNRAAAEYALAHPDKRATDERVLRWYFAGELARLGLRAARIDAPAFKTKLRTMAKRLSDLRHPSRKFS